MMVGSLEVVLLLDNPFMSLEAVNSVFSFVKLMNKGPTEVDCREESKRKDSLGYKLWEKKCRDMFSITCNVETCVSSNVNSFLMVSTLQRTQRYKRSSRI